MRHRDSTVRDISLGAGLALVISGAIVAAQVSTGAAKSPRTDPLEPCCAVVSIDAKAGTVTAKVTATGKTFTLTDISTAELGRFKVGAPVDLTCGVPPTGGGTGVTGNAASGCGSNVGRNADTRPKECIATNSAGVQTKIACPEGVPIKQGK